MESDPKQNDVCDTCGVPTTGEKSYNEIKALVIRFGERLTITINELATARDEIVYYKSEVGRIQNAPTCNVGADSMDASQHGTANQLRAAVRILKEENELLRKNEETMKKIIHTNRAKSNNDEIVRLKHVIGTLQRTIEAQHK